ncbi:low molecular weight protein-tyrosine-phosphatase [Litoreibacter roseus]|uniref:protein-tyrosine-phosphatase n=1 Tax=Litoreibacter roseus TaxID=2601869 RepID=A0A6N6JB63_9RHOB|nr:low molecular weight protein-tyrosine-phosphatase [Litoreibacter roseus]GFE63473.1 phosphotyrosine protein phosphatase [Litoreibacter roseus]
MTDVILFVCMTDLCQSPLAKGVLRRELNAASLDFRVESAATSNWNTGDPPDERAIVAARLRGMDISESRAQQISPGHFVSASLIIPMSQRDVAQLEKWRPAGVDTPVRLLSSFAPDIDYSDIPDPYYTGRFDPVIDLIETCVAGLVEELKTNGLPKAGS